MCSLHSSLRYSRILAYLLLLLLHTLLLLLVFRYHIYVHVHVSELGRYPSICISLERLLKVLYSIVILVRDKLITFKLYAHSNVLLEIYAIALRLISKRCKL